MPQGGCRRCGEAVSAFERYCRQCGLDQKPDAPLLSVGDAKVARKREEEWLRQPRDLKRLLEDDSSTSHTAARAAVANGDREAEPPLDELLYWVRSACMLGDLQSLATAQVERLRARCADAGMPAAELDRRVEEAVGEPRAGDSVAPAGWYPDPAGNAARRYWTGTSWTERVR